MPEDDRSNRSFSRRGVLRTLGVGAGVAGVATAAPAAAQPFGRPRPSRNAGQAASHPVIAENPLRRASEAVRRRFQDARVRVRGASRPQATNGDEARYDDYRASYTKGLPHDALGEVDRDAYRALLAALGSGTDAAYARVPLAPGATRKLADPQAAYAFLLSGQDGQACRMPAAPTFASDETAGEMAELYWKAVLRDRPFAGFEDDALVARAAAELNALPVTPGAKDGGRVDASTVFRGETSGDRTGPLVSQLLWADVPFGNGTVTQRYPTPGDRADWMTSAEDWLAVQRGRVAGTTDKRGFRFIHDGRSLAEYVHVDFTYQAYLNAALVLLGLGPDFRAQGSPARTRTTTGSFVTFGGADVVDVVAKVANQALHAAWFQKWCAHRRLRPETYGGRLHHQMAGTKDYGLPSVLTDSEAVRRVQRREGTAFLPQAYPEGSPTHPAYPAGHATVAGACCTVLKAFFDEDAPWPSPVAANANGTALQPYAGALTVGGEIDKLASNVTLGRDWAGVHYRSDGIEGMTVGEDVALAYLADHADAYAQDFAGFTLTRFDGTRVTVGGGGARV